MFASAMGKGQPMTTDSTMAADSAEERFERIHLKLDELRQRTRHLSGRAREANATAAELRSGPRAVCHHGAEVEQLTATLAQVEHELEGLQVAMATRGVIEQAKGMLMLREGCDAEEAFAKLVDLSQHGHRKLIDVARTMVSAWSAGDSAQP
jgi:Fic family protein